jgi:hypothetical protein
MTIGRGPGQLVADDTGELPDEPGDSAHGLVQLLLAALLALRPACGLGQLPASLLLPLGRGGQLRLQL